MKNNGLTMTIIFDGNSLNYGEGMYNISTLKKLSRGDNNCYTYMSRQAISYSIRHQLGWDVTPTVMKGKVAQYCPTSSIVDYPEIDLFGYMKTAETGKNKKKGETADNSSAKTVTRTAPVRISNAVSLEKYNADTDFLTNMGLSIRVDGKGSNTIATSEIHRSFYAYTITVDLDRIGIDGDIEIPNEEKANRVITLLKQVEILNRRIRGRDENIGPIFVVGNLYSIKNSYFENRVELNKRALKVNMIKSVIDGIEEPTMVGYLPEKFDNDAEIVEKLHPMEISEFFNNMCDKVKEYYCESNPS